MGCLFKKGKVKRVLVVSPSSVCAVWQKDMESFAAFPWTAKVLLGDKKHRLAALRELESYQTDGVEIAIINYEAVFRKEIFDVLLKFDADLIIADESQRIKSNSAKQSMAMHKLGDRARYKLILSGTPVQNNAVDLYSQYRFMDSSIFGTNFYSFRGRYCLMGGFQAHQIVGYKHKDELIRKVHSAAFRITKAEALDLPEQTFENRYVNLASKERKVYDQLRRDGFTELENEETITATTVLTKLLRLQQFTGGFLPDEAGRPQVVNTAKLDALSDILQDYVIDGGGKLVIFARFTAEIEAIGKLIDKLEYLCELNGITLVMQEESYTSKASFWDKDVIPVYKSDDTEEYHFSGKRIHRGQYRTASGQVLNADVNGALTSCVEVALWM